MGGFKVRTLVVILSSMPFWGTSPRGVAESGRTHSRLMVKEASGLTWDGVERTAQGLNWGRDRGGRSRTDKATS